MRTPHTIRAGIGSRQWGSQQDQAVTDPVNFTSRELVRVEAPSPSVWNVICRVENVNPLNVGVTFRALVVVGVGRVTTGLEFTFSPFAGPFQIAMLPAAYISVVLSASGAVPSPGSWVFTAFAAPFIPWPGAEDDIAHQYSFGDGGDNV